MPPQGGPDAAVIGRQPMKQLVAGCALLAVLLPTLGACGDDRPSTDEIAGALRDADNAAGRPYAELGGGDQAIDCVARVLHDSDLSDDALRAIVDGDEGYDADADDQEAAKDLVDDLSGCVTG